MLPRQSMDFYIERLAHTKSRAEAERVVMEIAKESYNLGVEAGYREGYGRGKNDGVQHNRRRRR